MAPETCLTVCSYSLILLRSVDSPETCIYAKIRKRIAETISWDYNFEPAGSTPLTFTVKVVAEFEEQWSNGLIEEYGKQRIMTGKSSKTENHDWKVQQKEPTIDLDYYSTVE